MQLLEQCAGWLVIAIVLLDVFLTVLYARAGAGLFSYHISLLIWHLSHGVSRLLPDGYRGTVMSLCGPLVLVAMITFWAFSLMLGAALVIHPALGTGVISGSGETKTDFVTAMYAGGSSLSIVGAGDFTPLTAGFQFAFLFNSLAGMSVVSMTVTYIVQVYNALQSRNSLSLRAYLLTNETADAAVLLANIGREGKFDNIYSTLASLADDAARVKEAHHFYPVLFYFRFTEAFYSVSQFALISLDAVTLIESALDDERFRWLKTSGAVVQLERVTTLLLKTLAGTFLPENVPDEEERPDPDAVERWRSRYHAAVHVLRQAGIETARDAAGSAEDYIARRAAWDRYISALAPALGMDPGEIDPAANSSPAPSADPSEDPRQQKDHFSPGTGKIHIR